MRSNRRSASAAGFTLFELLVVLAIFGILGMVSYPSVQNAFTIRSFDATARDITSTLQMAKWQAVNTKLNHRVRFISSSGRWSYLIEAENPSGTWTAKRNLPTKIIDPLYVVTASLPVNSSIIFEPTGFINGFDSTKNQITLSSAKLANLGQLNRRLVRFYASGSVQFLKDSGS
jgi:prepilin-type N-terminal cleavage/methylation domain-containing protein